MPHWATVVIIIAVVLVCCALIGWMGWWVLQWPERPRTLRRVLLFLGVLYLVGAVTGTWRAATGEAPLWSLLFLPLSLGIAWLYLRSAGNVRVPPNR